MSEKKTKKKTNKQTTNKKKNKQTNKTNKTKRKNKKQKKTKKQKKNIRSTDPVCVWFCFVLFCFFLLPVWQINKFLGLSMPQAWAMIQETF